MEMPLTRAHKLSSGLLFLENSQTPLPLSEVRKGGWHEGAGDHQDAKYCKRSSPELCPTSSQMDFLSMMQESAEWGRLVIIPVLCLLACGGFTCAGADEKECDNDTVRCVFPCIWVSLDPQSEKTRETQRDKSTLFYPPYGGS